MATKIFIDGYNFLWQSHFFRDKAITQLEKGREEVLKWLTQQPQLQNFEVKVVFDAQRAGSIQPSTTHYQSIEVIYSSYGQTADDLLKEFSSQYTAGAIIVSSDREVSRFAERKGCGVLGAREFQTALEHPEEMAPDPARRFSQAKRRALARLIVKPIPSEMDH